MMVDIVEKQVEMRSHFSIEAKNLLQGLLERDPSKRLGSSEEDSRQIKRHPWFNKINWDKLMKKQIEPPFKPTVTSEYDTRNIDKLFLNEPAKDTPLVNDLSPNEKKHNHFDQFTYIGQNDKATFSDFNN